MCKDNDIFLFIYCTRILIWKQIYSIIKNPKLAASGEQVSGQEPVFEDQLSKYRPSRNRAGAFWEK